MWELVYKERWALKNWWFWTVKRRLSRVPWTARRSYQSILKEISPGCSLIGRTDVEDETLILWPPHAKSWLIWKGPDAGKGWGQKEKGMTEDEMVGWLTDSMEMSLDRLQELVMDKEAWHAVMHRVTKSWTRMSDWAELNWLSRCFLWRNVYIGLLPIF